jgi:hypothetical protein
MIAKQANAADANDVARESPPMVASGVADQIVASDVGALPPRSGALATGMVLEAMMLCER